MPSRRTRPPNSQIVSTPPGIPLSEQPDSSRTTASLALLQEKDVPTTAVKTLAFRNTLKIVERNDLNVFGAKDWRIISDDCQVCDSQSGASTIYAQQGEDPGACCGCANTITGIVNGNVNQSRSRRWRHLGRTQTKPHTEDVPQEEAPWSLSTIRIVHPTSGVVKEVRVKANRDSSGTSVKKILDNIESIDGINSGDIRKVISLQLRDLVVIYEEDKDRLESNDTKVSSANDPGVCEAVLRSVFAPKESEGKSKDNQSAGEAVKKAFALPDAQYANAEQRARDAARYRRAEVLVKLKALERNRDKIVNPLQFENRTFYEIWKKNEAETLTKLLKFLDTFPSEKFSGSVQVLEISADHLKSTKEKWITKLQCRGKAPRLQVYYSVTILPAEPETTDSDVSENGESTPSHKAAFVSEVIKCTESAEWQGTPQFIPVSSMQDRIQIEVWERKGTKKIRFKDSKKKWGQGRSQNKSWNKRIKKYKVAPRTGDIFLGQVIIPFSDIRSQGVMDGRLQGGAPAISYPLMDGKDRQHLSSIQLKFACLCEYFNRDAPPSKVLLKPPVEDIDKAYDKLLRVAFRAEGGDKLGSQWKQIIQDFSDHYRIRDERCTLGLVHVLAGKFRNDTQYFRDIVNLWSSVCTAAREGRLTKSELAVQSDIVRLLAKPAEEVFKSFHSSFPGNQAAGALSKLIELLALILRWDPNPKHIFIPLRSWIEESCEARIRMNLFCDTSGEKTEIKINCLIEAIDLVRSDLAEHATSFQDAFPAGFILPAISTPIYYKLVSQYLRSFMLATTDKSFTKDHRDLISSLLLLHKEIERIGVRLKFIDVNKMFEGNIAQWIATIKPRMVQWIISSCSAEKFELVSQNSDVSFSVLDLYDSLNRVVDGQTSSLLILPTWKQYIWYLEAGICAAVQLYASHLEKLCLQDFPEGELMNEDSDRLPNSESTPCKSAQFVTESLCIKLNNINEVIAKQQEFESDLNAKWRVLPEKKDQDAENLLIEDDVTVERFASINDEGQLPHKVGEKFKDLRKILHHMLNNVIHSIVEIMEKRLESQLQSVLEGDEFSQTRLEPMIQLLDQNIQVMEEYLQANVFQRILKDISGALCYCMEQFVLNRDNDPKPMTLQQRMILDNIVQISRNYFHRDGLGLQPLQIDQGFARLQKLLACWDLSTKELCPLYWRAWVKFNGSTSQKQQAPQKLTTAESFRLNQNIGVENGRVTSRDENLDALVANVELHVLDYFSLLKQRDDDEAKELVSIQSEIPTGKAIQIVFGLPKDEEILAHFACSTPSKKEGNLYITPKHIGFLESGALEAHDPRLFLVPFERLMSVHTTGSRSSKDIMVVPFNLRPRIFNKISDPETVCRAIYEQVVGSGTYLEKSMGPLWAERQSYPNHAIEEFHCSRAGFARSQPGTLLVYPTHVIFEQKEKQEQRMFMDHGSIASIAERTGLMSKGVVIKLETGEHVEFVDFIKPNNLSVAKKVQEMVSFLSHARRRGHH